MAGERFSVYSGRVNTLLRLSPMSVNRFAIAGKRDVLAICEVARVDQLDRRASQDENGVDAWVSVFEDKVRQIDAQRCQPIRDASPRLH
jgi:hypothetical protein